MIKQTMKEKAIAWGLRNTLSELTKKPDLGYVGSKAFNQFDRLCAFIENELHEPTKYMLDSMPTESMPAHKFNH